MKDMSSQVTEVRVKLHIKLSNEPEVKNMWMCLDYEQKPCISHVIDHVKKNLIDKKHDISECKLYLDNYWLPPYENSRLIRENDCIKVEVVVQENSNSEKASAIEKMAKLNQDVMAHIKATEQRIAEKQKEMEKLEYGRGTYKGLSPEEIATVEAATRAASASNIDYYNHYYENMANMAQTSYSQNYWESQAAPEEVQKPTKATNKPKQGAKQQQKQGQSPKETSCYKKFAIGSYAHLLNEPVQAPEQKVKKNKNKNKSLDGEVAESENQRINQTSEDFNKIAASVKSTGQQKWKNSTQQTKTNGPKHIIFRSSESSTSDSSADEGEEQEVTKLKQTAAPKLKVDLTKKSDNASKYYEPTKDEQLDAVSYNRSYFIKNTKNVIEFKKVFNEEKLNAPQAEEFAYKPDQAKKPEFDLNTSTSSTSSNKSESKKRSPKSPGSSKIAYETYPNMVGAPRVGDKIAFQILEISANFTPEISGYKTGVVSGFDESTNEITLELQNNKYNQVLKRPSKFSVILDETDKENGEQDEQEQEAMSPKSQDADNELKVDWRNLMNVKLCPKESELTKQQFFAQEEQQRPPMLHV